MRTCRHWVRRAKLSPKCSRVTASVNSESNPDSCTQDRPFAVMFGPQVSPVGKQPKVVIKSKFEAQPPLCHPQESPMNRASGRRKTILTRVLKYANIVQTIE